MLSTAIRRMGMLHSQLTTAPALVLDERILFLNLEETPTTNSNYKIHVDVRHDEKIIDFVTEAMCPNEKSNVYLRQKRMMRDMYPEYMITERHT